MEEHPFNWPFAKEGAEEIIGRISKSWDDYYDFFHDESRRIIDATVRNHYEPVDFINLRNKRTEKSADFLLRIINWKPQDQRKLTLFYEASLYHIGIGIKAFNVLYSKEMTLEERCLAHYIFLFYAAVLAKVLMFTVNDHELYLLFQKWPIYDKFPSGRFDFFKDVLMLIEHVDKAKVVPGLETPQKDTALMELIKIAEEKIKANVPKEHRPLSEGDLYDAYWKSINSHIENPFY